MKLSSRRATTRAVLLGMAAFVASIADAGAQVVRRTSDEPAHVEKEAITFFLPLPYEGTKAPDSPVAGYFVWRISVGTLQPFSLVVTSDSALRVSKTADVLKAVTVRLCADPVAESSRACVAPVAAKIVTAVDHFRIVLLDAQLIARVRRERPGSYWRYTVGPGGKVLLTQRPFAHQLFERP